MRCFGLAQLGGDPERADPGHNGEITSLGWPGNVCNLPEECVEITGHRDHELMTWT